MAKKKEDNSGLFVPAGLFIGLGLGALVGEWTAGVLLGLGAGFAAMAVMKNWGKKQVGERFKTALDMQICLNWRQKMTAEYDDDFEDFEDEEFDDDEELE